MGTNDYHKTREVLARVHEFLSNLCKDARCDDHCSECIGASDLADDVYDLLHTPPRNCDEYSHEEALRIWSAEPENPLNGCFDEWLYCPATKKKGGEK